MPKSADAFRTISEVAEWLETPAHVLRFWESKFSQVKPVKRAGGRRYYRPADMQLLGGIKQLLHNDGMTIKGVQKILREQGVKHVVALSQALDEVTEAEVSDFAADVPAAEEKPATGTVLSFQRDAEPEAEQEIEADPVAEAEPEPQSEPQPVAAAEPEPVATAEPEPVVEVEAAPEVEPEPEPEAAAPSEPVEPPQVDDTSPPADEPEAAEAGLAEDTPPEAEVEEVAPALPSFMHRSPEPTPAPETKAASPAAPETPVAPAKIDVPDDPEDTVDAEPGVLAALAGFEGPVSEDLAKQLGDLRDRLSSHQSDGRP